MIDEAFGHWLAGFIAGEGSFGIMAGKTPGSVRLAFDLILRADDAAILFEMQRRTGLGEVYGRPPRGNARATAGWRVCRRAECLQLVEILDRFPLRAKKADEYEVWREAARVWAEMEPRRITGTRRRKEDGSLGATIVAQDWGILLELQTEIRALRSPAAA